MSNFFSRTMGGTHQWSPTWGTHCLPSSLERLGKLYVCIFQWFRKKYNVQFKRSPLKDKNDNAKNSCRPKSHNSVSVFVRLFCTNEPLHCVTGLRSLDEMRKTIHLLLHVSSIVRFVIWTTSCVWRAASSYMKRQS